MHFQFDQSRIDVNTPDEAALTAALRDLFSCGQGAALATINLDHLVKLRSDAEFRAAYSGQELIVADGWPIVWLSRIAGQPVSKMPGSELILPLSELAQELQIPVALVGSNDVALTDAAQSLRAQVPGLNIVYQYAPPMGFDAQSPAAAAILFEVAASGARLCFLALGAPRQEVLAHRGRALAPNVVFASIGAGLDFLGGHQSRSPVWVRNIGMEWLWRALSNPLRLGPRYLKCLAILPGQAIKAWRIRRS
ncbi:MAG: WecB/TagA/CpsF family glycosyltransferase [Paracoccaceae bacterium]